MGLASNKHHKGSLSLTKLYAKESDHFRPSAWWAVKEVPGIVLCYINTPPNSISSSGWAAILVAEELGAKLPWGKTEIKSIAKWFANPMPLPDECPKQTKAALYAINNLDNRSFATRREALQSLEVALLVADKQIESSTKH